ncbi:MAG: histidine phosphatase family protein [Flammeovirgaceae bacterium]|nr:histidine phosphatase family protein [Flammeovirgaceae bacterium]
MISKKIYLIRHGQTDLNLQGIVQGSGVDSSINAKGMEQSVQFFNAFKHINFDKVYTSALKRTKETVEEFIKLGIPHEVLPGLNEISWGNKEGQRITPEEDEYYHYMLKEWEKGNTSLRIEEGESPEDVVKRMSPVVDHIFSKPSENTILICMHGRAMRILLTMLLNYPLKSMDMFEHNNLCLYLLNYTGSMCRVERYNDTKHLS